MTKEELEIKLKETVKNISNKEKNEFLKKLKDINKKTDKLDGLLKNVLDNISVAFTFSKDKKIIKLINDIAENIDDPKLDKSVATDINLLIESFLDTSTSKKNDEQKNNEKGKVLWEETKKVRKAL